MVVGQLYRCLAGANTWRERRMQFDRAKLKDAVLYACSKCEPSRLGAVKLHKVLYFSDMLRYANVGAPLTGATYRKRPMGPTCDQLLGVLSELSHDGALEIRNVEYFGYLKKEYIPTRANLATDSLSAEERVLLDEVIEFVCVNNTAKTISEFSHNKAWDMAEFGAEIKYNSVFNLFPVQVSQETWDWALQEANEIATERSKKTPVEGRVFSTLRKKILAGVRH
jgi:hypothetical protein